MALTSQPNQSLENAKQSNYKVGINKFADMSDYEYKQILSYKGGVVDQEEEIVEATNFTYPSSKDWTTEGAVTGVKDQGQCGSCWSFSTTGSLEGFYYISHGTLPSLSEQYFVDCDTLRHGGSSFGCNGGNMYSAHKFAAQHKVAYESDYPY